MAAGSLTVREIVTRWGFKVDQKAIRDFDKSLNRLKKTAKAVTIAFGAAAVGVGFFINEAAKFEQTEIAFETLIGDAEVSKKKLEELFAFARETPFTIPSVLREAKRFLAFGFGVEELIPTLDLVGNIAASVGTEKLPFIVKALADVRGASRLMGREVLQFINAGVAIIPILEKELGKNSKTIKKMIEQGQISFQKVLEVLNKLPAVTNRLMARQAKTFLGIISNIQDGLIVMSIAIGQSVLPEVKKLAKEFLTFIDVNKKLIQARAIEFMKSLGKSVLSFIKFMRNLIKILNSIVKLFGGWERVIKGVTFALLGLLAVNFLSFLGSGVILLGKFVIMLGKARVGALLLQGTFLIMPLAIGAAIVASVLLIEDFIAFLKGDKVSAIGLFLGIKPGGFGEGIVEAFKLIAIKLKDVAIELGVKIGNGIIDGIITAFTTRGEKIFSPFSLLKEKFAPLFTKEGRKARAGEIKLRQSQALAIAEQRKEIERIKQSPSRGFRPLSSFFEKNPPSSKVFNFDITVTPPAGANPKEIADAVGDKVSSVISDIEKRASLPDLIPRFT